MRRGLVTDECEVVHRGRPRDASVDERVMAATWELLPARGYAALNVDEVAERAAVAKTTLYRRWPTKDHLVSALAGRAMPPVPVPNTGDLRDDLTEFAWPLVARMYLLQVTGDSGSMPGGVATELLAAGVRHRDLGVAIRAFHGRLHAMALDRLRKASEHEGLRPDLDHALLIDQLLGPLYYRVLVTGATTDRHYVERLVEAVLDGAFTAAAPAG
jgi:AcrR family transcriptional regulator